MAIAKRQEYKKRNIETQIMTAQVQAISTKSIKAKTDKTQAESKCRLYGKVDETGIGLLFKYSLIRNKISQSFTVT